MREGRGLERPEEDTTFRRTSVSSHRSGTARHYFDYATPGPPSWSVPSGPPSGPPGPSGSPAGSGVVDSSSAAWSTDPVLLLFEATLWATIRPPASISAAIANNVRVIFFMVRQLLKLPKLEACTWATTSNAKFRIKLLKANVGNFFTGERPKMLRRSATLDYASC